MYSDCEAAILTWCYGGQGSRVLYGRPLDEEAPPTDDVVGLELQGDGAPGAGDGRGRPHATERAQGVGVHVGAVEDLTWSNGEVRDEGTTHARLSETHTHVYIQSRTDTHTQDTYTHRHICTQARTHLEIVVVAVVQVLDVDVQEAYLDVAVSVHGDGPAVVCVAGVRTGVQGRRQLPGLSSDVITIHWRWVSEEEEEEEENVKNEEEEEKER